MGYKEGDIYLTRVEPVEGGAYIYTFFLDAEGQPEQLQTRDEVKGVEGKVGFFNEGDIPQGEAYSFILTDSQLRVVGEPGAEKTYVIQNAPQSGYYVTAKVYMKLKEADMALQLQNNTFVSMSEEDVISDFSFDYQIMDGYKLETGTVTELSYEDCFDLEMASHRNRQVWELALQERYLTHSLVMWIATTEGDEGSE